MRRRASLRWLASAAWLGSGLASGDEQSGPAGLMQSAEAALARGDAAAAELLLDRASSLVHAADVEMMLVRTYMQAGEYRRALAFAAHAAGSHADAPAAAALYAWLLAAGGQGEAATRVLAPLLSDRVAAETARQLAATRPVARDAMLELPQRMAPYATAPAGKTPPHDGGRVVSSGILLAAGDLALVAALPAGTTTLRVRNGLGQSALASVERVTDGAGPVLARLLSRMPSGGDLTAAVRDPFAGSPGFVVGYARSPAAEPAWPWLRLGFLGAFDRNGTRRLGIDVASLAGGAVFDAAGRFAGLAVGEGSAAVWWPTSLLRERFAGWDSLAPPASTDGATRIGADQVYERALRRCVQVIA